MNISNNTAPFVLITVVPYAQIAQLMTHGTNVYIAAAAAVYHVIMH